MFQKLISFFFCGKKKVDDIGILINNEKIERVYSTKLLGIHIDSNLSWKQHVTILKGKLSKCLYILYKCSDSLESDSLKTLYCSLFFYLSLTTDAKSGEMFVKQI